jgi:hypothetical protein
LASGIELEYPERLAAPLHAISHLPFAMWIAEAVRPRVIVDLGVGSGNAYCAFLQAVHALGLECRAYGLDCREAEHGPNGSEPGHHELGTYHDQKYAAFSSLLRAPLAGASAGFADGSVDLLHLAGSGAYADAAKDLAAWLPKMSPRGVILVPDSNARERSFGVWRLWEDMAQRYPSFEFVHGRGLGVAWVGSEPPPERLRALFDTKDATSIARVRAYFARLGLSLVDRFRSAEADTTQRGRVEAALRQAAAGEQRLRTKTGEAEQAAALVKALQAQIATILRQQVVVASRMQQETALAEQRLKAMQGSISWRLTAPIRVVSRQLPWVARGGKAVLRRAAAMLNKARRGAAR